MDVRASLNSEGNLSLVTGDGQQSFTEDSFFAKVPPQAASTVARSKARRYLDDSEGGSFIEGIPNRKTPTLPDVDSCQQNLSTTTTATNRDDWSVVKAWCRDNIDQEERDQDEKSSLGILNVEDMDLSSTNLLLECPMEDLLNRHTGDCPDKVTVGYNIYTTSQQAGHRQQHSRSDPQNGSSLSQGWHTFQQGEKVSQHTSSTLQHSGSTLQHSGSTLQHSGSALQHSGSALQHSGSALQHSGSTLQHSGSTLQHSGSALQHSGSALQHSGSTLQHSGSALQHSGSALQHNSSALQHGGTPLQYSGSNLHSSANGSNHFSNSRSLQLSGSHQVSTDSNNSQDSKQDQPFARSQLGTVKKTNTSPIKKDPVATAICQKLFSQIGEEPEDGDVSVYNVELGEDELKELDMDFGEMNTSLGGDSEGEEANTPTNKEANTVEIDSIYLRPGLMGEEQQTRTTLPYLSKVSLFDGGSGSEIDTEDELELARQAQGTRHEAAGQASQEMLRPGLVGSDSSHDRQPPITQRQSAEGDVVSSPVPGDGGGGGDGSSGSDSEDGRRSNMTDQSHNGYNRNYTTNQLAQIVDQEQRIKPMGDDLLSEMRFRPYNSVSNPDEEDSRIHARYLTPSTPADSISDAWNQFNLDDFLSSRQQEDEDLEFDPGNRLEASGFNADDFSALVNNKNSNPFDLKASSFGSWGNNTPEPDASSPVTATTEYIGDAQRPVTSAGSDLSLKQNRLSGEDKWCELDGSLRTSQGSAGAQSRTSPAHTEEWNWSSASLGKRCQGPGSPARSSGKSSGLGSSYSLGQSQTKPVPPLNDVDVFKKPAIPVLKSAGNFSKSMAKTKARASSSANSSYSSGKSSGRSSGEVSNQSAGSSKSRGGLVENELAFRMSLTQEAEEQRHCLKRVPSIGGTSELDLTVPDEEFFGSANARAMLDADEDEFQKENIISEVDAMIDKGGNTPDDSWAYRSVMSIARPSWLENPNEEETVHVRISVGSYMRSKTGALGALDGHGKERPDFGLAIASPPKNKSRIIQEEEMVEEPRTSGVGQYGNGTPAPTPAARIPSEEINDDTLTMESLTNTPAKDKTISHTLDLEKLDVVNSTKLSMGELSILLKQCSDPKTNLEDMLNLHAQKSRSGHKENLNPSAPRESASSGIKSSNYHEHKTSTRPALQVSKLANTNNTNLTRSFPKVYDGQNMKDNKSQVDVHLSEKNKSPPITHKKSAESDMPEEFFSPNASAYCPSTPELIDRLIDFKFCEGDTGYKDVEIKHQQDKDVNRHNVVLDDREMTPDGEDRHSLQQSQQSSKQHRQTTHAVNQSRGNEAKYNDTEMGKLSSGSMDHGYMPGHHIPDGTEYSQRSDYTHMNHRGMLREDVAGVEDVGLAESRGFDMLKRAEENKAIGHHRKMSLKDKTMPLPCPGKDREVNPQPPQSLSPMLKTTYQQDASSVVSLSSNINKDKPYLLTKHSLMQTDFAKANLQHNHNRETMDRIYTRNSFCEDFCNFDVTEQTMLQQHDESTISQQMHNSSQFKVQGFSHLQSLEQNLSSISDYNQKPHNVAVTPARSLVYPVEAPGVLKFEACCVGIVRGQKLKLRNPTAMCMECSLQVLAVEIEGQTTMNTNNSPFELRRKRVILRPNDMSDVDVLFVPKLPGTHIAQLEILSNVFRKEGESRQSSIPVTVTLLAIGEEPVIKVSCDDKETDCVDFGELAWGTCQERSISLRNMKHSTVPLRLVISSNYGTWHCFSFEPESLMSDVSVISGQQRPLTGHGKSIINLSIPGCHDPCSTHEVRIWCRPPEKHLPKNAYRHSPEQFTCRVDIEVDIPSSKSPKIKSMLMKAVVGVQKFRVNKKILQFSCHPGQIEESRVTVLNAGNLNISLHMFISDGSGAFSVSPSRLSLAPKMSTELNVVFTAPKTPDGIYQSLLLMQIVPSGDLYEVTLNGRVEEQQRPLPMIHTNGSYLHFGGVPIRTTVVKKFEMLSKETKAERLKLISKSPEVLFVPSKEPSVGCLEKDIYITPGSMVSVFVAYTPTFMSTLNSTISISVPNCRQRFKTRVSGYGGVGRLCCDEDCLEQVRDSKYPCIALNPSTQAVKDLFVTNAGLRPVNVNIAVFSDEECKRPLQSWSILVRPNKVTMVPGQKQKLVVTLGIDEQKFVQACQRSRVGAYLGIAYQDDVAVEKPARGLLVVEVTLSTQLGNSPTADGLYSPPKSSMQTHSKVARTNPIENQNSSSRPDRLYDAVEDTGMMTGRDNTGGWSVEPRQLTLFCCRKGNPQFERIYIHNYNNSDMNYEILWPGGMFSLSQDSGTVKGREYTWIHVYPSVRVARQFDQIPWTGKLSVTCGRQTKVVNVVIEPDTSPVEQTVPEQEVVGPSMSGSQQASSSRKMGSLEVSTTLVQFSSTQVDKTSEETIELKNVDTQALRWMFSSFASPYLKKKSESRKDVFRVSYKVFDFSRQFGKLNGQSTIVLKLSFMPRSSGTFSQFWDVQTSGNISTAGHNDYLRIHLTGEAFEPVEDKKKPSRVIDLLKNERPLGKCKLQHDTLQFHVSKVGKSETMKAQVKNNYMEDIKVEVVGPKPPFYIRHSSFTVDKKRYLRFPVDFQPSRPGRFTDVVKFQVSKGENLILNLVGQCENT